MWVWWPLHSWSSLELKKVSKSCFVSLLCLMPFTLIVLCIFRLTLIPFTCRKFEIATDNDMQCLTSFKDEDQANERFMSENKKRLQDASRFIHSLENRPDRPAVMDILVAIITKARQYPHTEVARDYLTQVVGRVLQLAAENNHIHIEPFLCVTDIENASVSSKYEEEISLIMTALRSTMAVSRKRRVFAESTLERERLDYAFCLEQSLINYPNFSYILLLEDDAIPSQYFLSEIKSVIHQIENRHRVGHILFVKLFHPNRLRKLPFYFQVACISALCAMVPLIIMCTVSASSLRPRSSFSLVFGYVLSLNVFFIVLQILLWMGPEPIAYVRYRLTGSVYLTYPESCCTPAVLFPRNHVSTVLQFFMDSSKKRDKLTAKDEILDEIPSLVGSNAVSLMTDRNLIKHIGRYSTLRKAPVSLKFLN